MTASSAPDRELLPRGLLILLGLASATIATSGMKAIAGIIAPTMLALVLVICVQPLRRWLVARGAPTWLAAIATVLAVYLVLIALIVALVVCLAKLATLAPSYTSQANDVADQTVHWLATLGVDQKQIDTVVQSLDFGKLFGVATTILSSVLNVLSDLLFIGTITLFLAFDTSRFVSNLAEARPERPAIVEALLAFAVGTRTYFIVSAVFGLVVAVVDTGALWLLGVPAAVVWGVLSFVTNFIPNVGFVIGLVPPAILALLEGGPGLMIAVIVTYSVINFVIQSVVQPKFVGDALGLTTSLTFLSLVFWAWVLGPLGAILALPLTLLAKALLVDVDPGARWLGPLLSGVPTAEVEPSPRAVAGERARDEG